ncbi:hypothetical protein NQZ79_g5569 [Umbelopsis isabellina]|nr:hypothetical protein NQZ79_g5569 [Umbelopsis isabellina]
MAKNTDEVMAEVDDDEPLVDAGKEPPPDNNESIVDAENEEVDPAIMRLLNHGLSDDVVRDLAVNGQLGEEEELEARQLYNPIPVEEFLPKLADGWKGTQSLTTEEINAIQHICSVLKPYMPPKDTKLCIVLRLPIVMISNIVQRVSGYQAFTRSICPNISPAKIHSFSIDTAAIYELMGSNTVGENFTMVDQNNLPISSVRWAIANKEATFASFLNVRKIKEECAKNRLVFLDRFIYKADDSVDLIGELYPEVTPAISFYDQRRKMKAGGTKQSTQNIRHQLEKHKGGSPGHKGKQKRPTSGSREAVAVSAAQGKKIARNHAQSQVFRVKKQLKEARAKVHKNNEPIPPPPPTNTRVAHEDDAKHIKIAQLLSEAAADEREVVYSGTDYGICTQSTTVRIPFERFQAHLKLYNYFETLNLGQERQSDSIVSSDYA